MSTRKKVIAVKVGSNVITNRDGFPDLDVINNISKQIKILRMKVIRCYSFHRVL
jgi:glutamate 5-kinase